MALYKTLGCAADATEAELKRAYHRLALVMHPDKGGSATAFSDISIAWRILRNVTLRRAYDASLLQSGVPIHQDLNCCSLMLDTNTGQLSTMCRCGGTFALYREDLLELEPVLVPCDTCSFHVRVWPVT